MLEAVSLVEKIWFSIKREPKSFAVSVFLALTSIWALLEPVVSVYVNNPNKYWFTLFFVVPSLTWAIVRIFPKKHIQIDLKNTNTIVNVAFGDLFKCNGNIAIGVNEYFDSEIGKPVSSESLHGIFIEEILGGKRELFDDAVKNSLGGQQTLSNQRNLGKDEIYPIGSTAALIFGERKYLLFALSKTNDKYEAYSTPSIVLDALDGLFEKARSECNGKELNLPLLGTRLSRSGVPAKYLIDLIMIAILNATKKAEVTKVINIIIYPSYFREINLNEIKRKWN